MSRTLRFKISWLLIVVVGFAATAFAIHSASSPLVTGLILAAVLLVPGRIQGACWRQFFRGRRAQGRKEWRTAIGHYTEFLAQVHERPWLKRLIWLSWGIYSRDISAMAENNLGCCHLALGERERAEQHLKRSMASDSSYPLPHFNLALLKEIQGDPVAACAQAEIARKLGYAQTPVDALILRVSGLLAVVEGRGSGDSIARRQ